MIPLPGRALSTTIRRSMSIDHSLRDVHVSSNNLCRFSRCGFPGCEPNVLKHLCIPTEFLWHPSHCSVLLNPSLQVHHQVRIIDFTLAYPNAPGKSRFPLAATRRHSCRKQVPQLLTHLSNFTAVHHETWVEKRVIIHPTEFTRNDTIGLLGRNSRPIFRSSFNLYVLKKPAANLLAPSTCPTLCLGYAGEPRTIVDFARRSLTAFAMDIVAGSWSVWRMTVVWHQWSSIATM